VIRLAQMMYIRYPLSAVLASGRRHPVRARHWRLSRDESVLVEPVPGPCLPPRSGKSALVDTTRRIGAGTSMRSSFGSRTRNT